MMNELLEKDFVRHYKLGKCKIGKATTTDKEFSLIDNEAIICSQETGIAKYNNPNQIEVNAINYETFIDSLSGKFKKGREKCDIIVYASDFSHFILNELTDTDPKYINDFTSGDGTLKTGKRNKAISQLKKTLIDLSNVVPIQDFINKYTIKRCCFFNRKINSPSSIIATTAFNRLSSLSYSGYLISDSYIESYGFELWEFSGNQAYELSLAHTV